MSRSIITAAATIAAAALMPQVPAAAQQPGITVIAPRVHSPDEPMSSTWRPQQVFASAWVPTADLNLRSAYGRYVLDQRMRLAATQACNQLRADYMPVGVGVAFNPDPQNCRHRAYKVAQRRAGYVIYAYG